MYAVETDINFTNLYTIDLATGTPTLIGATGIPAVIDIAVDGEGIIWAHDIVGDNIYTIDKTTGVGTWWINRLCCKLGSRNVMGS